jgi:hypothetical protein
MLRTFFILFFLLLHFVYSGQNLGKGQDSGKTWLGKAA